MVTETHYCIPSLSQFFFCTIPYAFPFILFISRPLICCCLDYWCTVCVYYPPSWQSGCSCRVTNIHSHTPKHSPTHAYAHSHVSLKNKSSSKIAKSTFLQWTLGEELIQESWESGTSPSDVTPPTLTHLSLSRSLSLSLSLSHSSVFLCLGF